MSTHDKAIEAAALALLNHKRKLRGRPALTKLPLGDAGKFLVEDAGFIIAAYEAAKREADPDGWIPWSGGGCPVPLETLVDVTSRDGRHWERCKARGLRWSRCGGDIIAYRVVKP